MTTVPSTTFADDVSVGSDYQSIASVPSSSSSPSKGTTPTNTATTPTNTATNTSITDAASPPQPTQIPIDEDDLHTIHDALFAHADRVALKRLRKLASQGVSPDLEEWRGVLWRVLLGYLPPHKQSWPSLLHDKRLQYKQMVQQTFCDTVIRDVISPHKAKELVRQRSRESMDHHRSLQEALQAVTLQSVKKKDPTDGRPTTTPATTTTTTTTTLVLPRSVKEAWKRQGRDKAVLEAMIRGNHLNALRVNRNRRRCASAAAGGDANNTSGNDHHHNNHTTKEDDHSHDNDNNNHHDKDDSNENDLEYDWNEFMERAVLLDEIRKDVNRTHPDLSFYLEPQFNVGPRRYAALERILLVWATQHPTVKYVQGMNELVGTLFYVLAVHDCDPDWRAHAEADTYWLLDILLHEMRDLFLPQRDHASTGIQGRMKQMQTLLRKHDPEVNDHLHDELGIDASFYAVRWWTTLLSREFLLPDTIRLWDTMFASTHRDNFLRYVCVTMVMLIRDDLLRGDFSTCLRLLQSYPSSVHMDYLLESTRALWIYESQITMACHKGGISLHQALQTIKAPPAIVMAFGLRSGTTPPEVSVPILPPTAVAAGLSATALQPLSSTSLHAAPTSSSLSAAAPLQLLRNHSDFEHEMRKVRDATSSWLDRARGLYSKYSAEFRQQQQQSQQQTQRQERVRSQSADSSSRTRGGTSSDDTIPSSNADDSSAAITATSDIYLDAILSADPASTTTAQTPDKKQPTSSLFRVSLPSPSP